MTPWRGSRGSASAAFDLAEHPNIREIPIKKRPESKRGNSRSRSQNRGFDKCLIPLARMARETGLEPAASAVTGRNNINYINAP